MFLPNPIAGSNSSEEQRCVYSSHSSLQSPAAGQKHSGLLDTDGKPEVPWFFFSCAPVDMNGLTLLIKELLQKLLHTQIPFIPALCWLFATGVDICRLLQDLFG